MWSRRLTSLLMLNGYLHIYEMLFSFAVCNRIPQVLPLPCVRDVGEFSKSQWMFANCNACCVDFVNCTSYLELPLRCHFHINLIWFAKLLLRTVLYLINFLWHDFQFIETAVTNTFSSMCIRSQHRCYLQYHFYNIHALMAVCVDLLLVTTTNIISFISYHSGPKQ